MSGVKNALTKMKRLFPSPTVLLEILGLLLLALGTFLLVSLFTYDAADLLISDSARSSSVANLGGPVGAGVAHRLFASFGIVGFFWAIGISFWGLFTVLGFIRWPQTKRFLAFCILAVILAGFAHLQFMSNQSLLPHGVGGSIGRALGSALHRSFGYGGAIILLSLLAIIGLVLSGNLKISHTARAIEYTVYFLRKNLHISSRSMQKPVLQVAAEETRKSTNKKASNSNQVDDEDVTTSPLVPDFSSGAARHSKPTPEIFKTAPIQKKSQNNFEETSQQLEERLEEFKIKGRIQSITEGPVVTTFEFQPVPGTKVSKIVGLRDDLARLLKVESLRVIPTIPGKDTVGFEVSNRQRHTIRFGDVTRDKHFNTKEMALPVVLGVDTFGASVVEDLAEMPHLLVAGSTGSGKSVFTNSLLAGLILNRTARELRLLVLDPKMVELADYKRLPHLACPVVTDLKRYGQAALDSLVREMEERYQKMASLGVKNIESFNGIIRSRRKTEFVDFEGKWQPLPFVVLLIDEFADMVLMLGKESEEAMIRLAQKARAAGIHLVITTQRPSVNVVTGLIKANFTNRIAFRVLSGVDSRTILDQIGAETLTGKGDMLFQSANGTRRLHGAFLDEGEVANMVRACG
jgi:S-DNA-T family DNA segregation ATPase FtsK/SpoIIIE